MGVRESERALRPFLSQAVAGFAEMNLHGFPIDPIAISLCKNEAAMKTLELIFRQFAGCQGHGSISSFNLFVQFLQGTQSQKKSGSPQKPGRSRSHD